MKKKRNYLDADGMKLMKKSYGTYYYCYYYYDDDDDDDDGSCQFSRVGRWVRSTKWGFSLLGEAQHWTGTKVVASW